MQINCRKKNKNRRMPRQQKLWFYSSILFKPKIEASMKNFWKKNVSDVNNVFSLTLFFFFLFFVSCTVGFLATECTAFHSVSQKPAIFCIFFSFYLHPFFFISSTVSMNPYLNFAYFHFKASLPPSANFKSIL